MNKELTQFKEIYRNYVPLTVKDYPDVRRVMSAYFLALSTNDFGDVSIIIKEVKG